MLTAGSVLLVALILLRQQDDLIDPIRSLSISTLGTLLLLQVAYLMVDSARYLLAIPTRLRASVGRRRWHRTFAQGRILNLVAPQIGTAYRAALLRQAGVPISTFVGSFAVVSWLGAAVALSGAAVAMAVSGREWWMFASAAGAVSAVTFVATIWARRRGSDDNRAVTIGWRRTAASLSESFLDLARDSPRLRRVAVTSSVVYLLGWASFVVASSALGIEDPVLTGTVVFSVTTVATSVALTPGSLGIAELAAGGAGTLVGTGAGAGVLISLVTRATGIVSVVVVLVGLRAEEGLRSASEPRRRDAVSSSDAEQRLPEVHSDT